MLDAATLWGSNDTDDTFIVGKMDETYHKAGSATKIRYKNGKHQSELIVKEELNLYTSFQSLVRSNEDMRSGRLLEEPL